MSDQITYDDKADLIVDTTIDNIFKVTASDMNEIKNVVNSHADDIDVANNNITDLNNNKLDADAVLNEASTDTDKPYSADYLNDKLVSVGATAPENGERVWFKKSKNLFNKNTTNILNARMNNTITADTNERMIFVECKPNTTYTCSKSMSAPKRNSIGTTTTLPTIGVAIDNAVYSATSPKTITTNANAKYIVWQVYAMNDTTETLQQMLDSIQIENGPATTYEPYVEPSINVDEEEWYSKPKVLWTNTTPTSTFASQTITLNDDISNYQYYEILSIGGQELPNALYSTGRLSTEKSQTRISVLRQYLGFRDVTINGTSVTIGDYGQMNTYGNATLTTNNTVCLPYKILGYKE